MEIDSGAVTAFFYTAAKSLHMGYDDPIMGADDNGMLTPPAWSMGPDTATADELAALVLNGEKTATCSPRSDYASENELPIPGLNIVCDGAGLPRALIRVTAVRQCAFDEVDADHARREGEGDKSLAYWQEVHERVFGGRVPVVIEEFELIYPRKKR